MLDPGTLDPEKLAANENGLGAFCRLFDGFEAADAPVGRLLGPVAYPGSDELPPLPLFIGLACGRC